MKIGEAASGSGISDRMIRHYEKIRLIPTAARRDSGYRDYDERDLQTLKFICRARDVGFSIEQIRTLLALWQDRDRSSADVKALALQRAAELGRKERQLHEMRRSLEHLAASCHGDDRPDCPILDTLQTSQGPCENSFDARLRNPERGLNTIYPRRSSL